MKIAKLAVALLLPFTVIACAASTDEDEVATDSAAMRPVYSPGGNSDFDSIPGVHISPPTGYLDVNTGSSYWCSNASYPWLCHARLAGYKCFPNQACSGSSSVSASHN